MRKLIAILNVVAWGGFWAFGYLALSADYQAEAGQVVIASLLAAVGGALGLWAWLALIRTGGETGQPRPVRPVAELNEGEMA